MFNPPPTTIQNFKTKQIYKLAPLVSDGKTRNQLIKDVYNCCSEDLIYKTLFQDRHPEGYSLQHAESFINYSEEGWIKQTHFIFGIFHPETNQLVGAIDIKSANKEKAEVGYWLSKNFSGLMTNALIAITKIAQKAGYQSLEIYTEVSNQKSERVVQRAGFQFQVIKSEEGEVRKYHLLKL